MTINDFFDNFLKLILIVFVVIIMVYIISDFVSINKENQDFIDFTETLKDSLAKSIIESDSNIIKINIKYGIEKQKAINLSDSAAIELFKQLCAE